MTCRGSLLLIAVLACGACASTEPAEPTDEEILATLPAPRPGDWPAEDATRVASERDRIARARAAEEADPAVVEEDDEGLLSHLDAWSPGIEAGNGTARDMFRTQDSPQGGEDRKSGEFLIVPLPFANPTIGGGVFLIGGYIFRPDPEDEVSPPSTVGAGTMYSSNGSWGAGLGGQVFLDEDRWRIGAALAYADINYRLFGVGQDFGGEGRSVPIRQKVLGLDFSVLYGLGGEVHLGPVVRAFRVDTLLNQGRPIQVGPIGIPLKPIRTTEVSVGMELTRDTRDDHFYPRDGELVDLQARFFRESLGGSNDYDIYLAAFNTYHSLAERTVLAGRVYGRFAGGDVPFYALSYLGALPDIRGYEVGRYQDRMLLAFQAEIRQELIGNLGVGLFAGFGQVQHRTGDFRLDDFLPGLGGGVTYNVAADSHVNLRADVAWGVDGWVFYLGVGQVF